MNTKWLKHSLRDGRGAVEYQIQPGEMMDGQVLKNCKEGKVLGVLPAGASYENGNNYIFAYVDKKETYAKCLSETVTQELILCSFESIVNTLVHMMEQGIELAYVVLDPEYIYMEGQKARLVCMPGKNAVMQKEEIPTFFRNVLANAVYLNSEDGDYVAKLLSAVNGDFELKSFLRVIHGLMMDAGIEIIEDKLEKPEEEKVEEITETSETAEAPVAEETPEAAETPVVGETPEEEPEVSVAEETPVEVPETAEVAEPPVAPEAAETPAVPEEPEVAESLVTNVISEDDIEFEPMPEELAAKIQRTQGAPKPQAQAQTQPQINAVPQTVVQPVAQPQASVTPQPMVQPQVQPQINPIPQSVAPIPQPTVQPQVSQVPPQPQMQPQANPIPSQPQMNAVPQPPIMTMPQPSGEPRPLIPPQPGMVPPQSGAKKPDPHLTRVKTGERISLPSNSFVIGKSQTEVNYTIADNPAVSRIHCTILRKENGVYYVRDENSTNNTYVNGEQVLSGTEKILIHNCKLVLGDEEFIYSLW